MARFGVICPAATGHLNPMMALCKELQRRHHQIVFFQLLETEAKVKAAGFECQTIGHERFPLGRLPKELQRLGELSGKEAFHHTVNLIREFGRINLREIPEHLRKSPVDALLIDEVSYSGGSIAESFRLPFVTISNALVLLQEPGVPPFFSGWKYGTSPFSRLRNRLGYFLFNRQRKPGIELINTHRKQWSLLPISYLDEACSKLAHISQQPEGFDFPRRRLRSTVHFVGPLHDSSAREPCSFPWERLDGRSLVYACMGTLQNRQQEIFGCIAKACADLPVQLAISLGGGCEPHDLKNLAGDPIVVKYAPQLEILKKTQLCITHAGLNTVLESLSQGVPVVAIPITNDQPGVSARVVWKGVGEAVPIKRLNSQRLKSKVEKVLTDPKYKTNVMLLRDTIGCTSGARCAADIVERVTRSATATRRTA
jgi:UDP:flavonoid glycosyltransferase YjiC (YdhE family)